MIVFILQFYADADQVMGMPLPSTQKNRYNPSSAQRLLHNSTRLLTLVCFQI